MAAIGAFVVARLRQGMPKQGHASEHGPAHVFRRIPGLLREHPALRAYLIANALWEMALSALKAFVILYLTIGLHYKLAVASLFGFLNFMVALKLIPAPAPGAAVPPGRIWFFALAAVTAVGAFASLGERLSITSVLAPLTVGAALLGVFYVAGGSGWEKVGGYVTMASSFTAFYTATAMMLASTFGRVVLPLGKLRRETDVPGGKPVYPIRFALGEPGVKQGQ